jgi:hypothetical protein
MVGLEPTAGGLQIRFHWTAEYHSCSFCAQKEPFQSAEYRQSLHVFIIDGVTVDVKMKLIKIKKIFQLSTDNQMTYLQPNKSSRAI